MGSRTSILFMAVDQKDVTLPISDWMNSENNIWQLFESARDKKSQNNLFSLTGKHGRHLDDILRVKDRCKLKSLDFLDLDILESNSGTTLHGIELVSAIRSMTIIIDELLNAVDQLSCLPIGHKSDQDRMQKAFEDSKIYHDVDLDGYYEEGLFILLKSILWVMNDALVNNKVLVYIKYSA